MEELRADLAEGGRVLGRQASEVLDQEWEHLVQILVMEALEVAHLEGVRFWADQRADLWEEPREQGRRREDLMEEEVGRLREAAPKTVLLSVAGL